MGSFNTVRAEARCPRCASSIEVRVQFKYGQTWQYEYALGDALHWGGPARGFPGKRCVVVDGVAGRPCPQCGFDDEWDFYVFVEDDKLTRVVPADGRYDLHSASDTYIVLATADVEGRLVDDGGHLIGTVRVRAEGGLWSGEIDLRGADPTIVSLFERYEELVNGQVFSPLDSVEAEVAQLDTRFLIPAEEEVLSVEDVQVYPSTRMVSFRTRGTSAPPRVARVRKRPANLSNLQAGLQRIGPMDVDAIRQQAEQEGFTVFVLPRAICHRASLVKAMHATLPLGTPAHRKWDALFDKLKAGLIELSARRIAIVWPGADSMENGDSWEFAIALETLGELARDLATSGIPQVVVFLVE